MLRNFLLILRPWPARMFILSTFNTATLWLGFACATTAAPPPESLLVFPAIENSRLGIFVMVTLNQGKMQSGIVELSDSSLRSLQ